MRNYIAGIMIAIGIFLPSIGIYLYESQAVESAPKVTLSIIMVEQEPLPTVTPVVTPTPIPTAVLTPTTAPTIIQMPVYEPMPQPINLATLHRPQLLNRDEVKWFMLYDQTDKIPYTAEFRCLQFAETVVNNARANGIQASSVVITWVDCNYNHAIVCFPTIEDGDVFVDATSGDWWVEAEYGQNNYDSYSMTDSSSYWYYDMTLAGG